MPAAPLARIPALSPAALAVAQRFATRTPTPLERAQAAAAKPQATPAVAAATPSAADMITTPPAIVAATAPTVGISTAPAITEGSAVASTERGVPLLDAERQVVDAWNADAAGLPEVVASVKTSAASLPSWALPAAGAAGLALVAFLLTRKK